MIGYSLALFLSAASAVTAQAEAGDGNSRTEELVEQAQTACGDIDALAIDARGMTRPEALAAAIEDGGAQAVIVYGGTFAGQDMHSLAPMLSGGCVYETDLSDSRWDGASASDIHFVRVNLSGAQMTGAKMQRTIFTGTNLADADLSGADLAGGEWIGAYWNSNLSGTDFRRANLTGFRFRCGITMDASCGTNDGTVFDGANFRQADLATLSIWGFDSYAGARFDETRVGPRAVRYLQDAEFAGPIFLASIESDYEDAGPGVRIQPDEVRQLQSAAITANRDVPSFDCVKAGNAAEKLICGKYEAGLRALDRDMAQLFREALAIGVDDRASQLAWLKRRNLCEDRGCMAESYQNRMSELFVAIGTQMMLAPDQSRSFHEDVLPVPETFRASALYASIIPALEEAAMQSATLTGMEDGTISAEGSAVGGNAHLCSLEVTGARYDPATAWYSGRLEDGTLVPLFRVWGDRLMFRYSGNSGNTSDEAADFMSCGARAVFGEMRDLGG